MNSSNHTVRPNYCDPTTGVSPTNAFIYFSRANLDRSIASRFEQQVVKFPEHVAVKYRDHLMTYDELNRIANRIARALHFHDDAMARPIALMANYDPFTFAVILGVLKAGKFIVPIELSLSTLQAKSILADTAPRILLATDDTLSRSHEWAESNQIVLNVQDLDSEYTDYNLNLEIGGSAYSHVLYTSGSTGRPKGVLDIQRNVIHHVMRVTNQSHISPNDRMAVLRPPSSSGALLNAFSALLNGTSLYLVNLREIGLVGLAKFLIEEEITFLHCGATPFRHFAQLLTGQEKFSNLRMVKLSSGSVSKADVDLFRKFFPNSILLHVLSSTEALTYRMHFIDRNSKVLEAVLPVGYPVEDMNVIVVDEDGKNLDFGVEGEIAVRSDYLFKCYWNQPALTQNSFISGNDNAITRTYRTRDIGLIRADGCLQYLGRKDFRLKIRGHSIQAEEVELALLQVSGIAQAAVAAHKDGFGDDRLVAYLAAGAQEMPTIGQIRESLKEKLPDYMVPSNFVTLKSLPLNPNGKVNRQELPAPDPDRPNLGTTFAEPSTPVETVMTKIWSEALGVNNIGIDDVFSDLGGDSLIAGRIITRLSRIFPWHFTLPEFYEAPTVAKSAQLLLRKAPSADLADKAARLSLEIGGLSSAQVEAMVAEERKKRP